MESKKGISLVVLMISIVVVVILSVATIVVINKNNPIDEANESVFKTNVDLYVSELNEYKASLIYSDEGDILSQSLNANSSTNPSIKDIITSMKDEDVNDFEIIDGKLSYIGKNKNKIEWAKYVFEGDSRDKRDRLTANMIAESPATYLGKTVTGKDNSKWQIFYADSKNIYLKLKDPIGNYTLSNNTSGYKGSADITDENILKWCNFVFKYQNSTNENSKAISYLLDNEKTDIWKKKGESAFNTYEISYTVGAPTIELFAASYNMVHSNKLEWKIIGANQTDSQGYTAKSNGYAVKFSNQAKYGYSVSGLNTSEYDKLWIPNGTDFWISSESSLQSNSLLFVTSSGNIGSAAITTSKAAYPIVCLKPGVELTSDTNNNGGYIIR